MNKPARTAFALCATAMLAIAPSPSAASDLFQVSCNSAAGTIIASKHINSIAVIAAYGQYIGPFVTFTHGTTNVFADPKTVGSEGVELLHTAFLYRKTVTICMKELNDVNTLLGVMMVASPPQTADEGTAAE